MGYIRRNGRAYYIRSIRRRAKVTSEYVGTGELAGAIEQLGPGHGALHKDGVAAQMALMRDELAPVGCSPIERLLAERAVLCWLHVALMEYEAVGAYAGARPDMRDIPAAREIDRRAEVTDRRLAHAQSRYVQTLTALAKLRRLALPAIVAQFNIARNQQVNVANLAEGVTEP
jgi:hypothetical protein